MVPAASAASTRFSFGLARYAASLHVVLGHLHARNLSGGALHGGRAEETPHRGGRRFSFHFSFPIKLFHGFPFWASWSLNPTRSPSSWRQLGPFLFLVGRVPLDCRKKESLSNLEDLGYSRSKSRRIHR